MEEGRSVVLEMLGICRRVQSDQRVSKGAILEFGWGTWR